MALIDTNYPGHSFIRDLGSGNFGVAKLFKDEKTGELVAVKFLKRGRQIHETVAYVERELLNHMQLSGHPNIVKFREVFLTNTHLAIAMDFASGGELFDRIVGAGRFSEDVARYFFQQLISGVAWCHSNGVCHRDLKLENSLLDRAITDSAVLRLSSLGATGVKLKICDFGYSKSAVFDSQPKSTVGTPAYIAPEVLNRKQYDGEVADVWSCGVTLYVMLVGAYPFEDPDDPRNFKKTIERIVAVQYSIPSDVRLSKECLDLLRRIFDPDPACRITLQQIRQHPWFVKNLPDDLKVGEQPMDSAPQFKQSEEDIRQLILAACTLGEGMVEGGKELHMEEYTDMYNEGESLDTRNVDQYIDAEENAEDDELMYYRSQVSMMMADKAGAAQARQGAAASEDSAMAGMMGKMGIGGGGGIDPELELELQD